ncbi:hypothetical protein BDK51DRAFT_29617 [Blyttiomyces helicus]|uniref:Uncharacterized protein n=1 Tax=Blyttiomyces helicus TaxID=388810 RepID=A0A4P9WQG9_9FUNG|nr:hypothetical protein BDK51DRAFT_29617 [Blyttiomyces helicus]|eukprot:RKO94413.1 hypothetical protein BDK51DRAFT_29617 [Blyttiomyces helicus]
MAKAQSVASVAVGVGDTPEFGGPLIPERLTSTAPREPVSDHLPAVELRKRCGLHTLSGPAFCSVDPSPPPPPLFAKASCVGDERPKARAPNDVLIDILAWAPKSTLASACAESLATPLLYRSPEFQSQSHFRKIIATVEAKEELGAKVEEIYFNELVKPGYGHLERLCAWCPNLIHLDLDSCDEVGDCAVEVREGGILRIAEKLHKLTTLNCKLLHHLDLSRTRTSCDPVDFIITSLPNLVHINVTECLDIEIESLLEDKPDSLSKPDSDEDHSYGDNGSHNYDNDWYYDVEYYD